MLIAIFLLPYFITANSNCSFRKSQPTVISDLKKHSLFLTIAIHSGANVTEVARVAANIQAHVNYVSPPALVTPATEVIAGVGFGESFYAKVANNPRNFPFIERKGTHGTMPATGGDLFIHAKSDSFSKLFELAQEIKRQMPPNSVDSFNDTYGFNYKNGRDLAGFIDGTENPVTPEHKQRVAVDQSTGGSILLAQRWVHNFTFINSASDDLLAMIVGRRVNDSIELDIKNVSSHVSRMVGSPDLGATAKFEVNRQSQPYGTLSTEAGLFFMSYANSTKNHDFMLDNMVGKGEDNFNDEIMLLSHAVTGNYWYFPGIDELRKLA